MKAEVDPQYFWTIIICLSLGTIAIRGSIIAFSSRFKISVRVREVFLYIPSAILPALVVPAAFNHQGMAAWAFGKERTLILILAVAVSYYSKNTLATILFGLVALYLTTQI